MIKKTLETTLCDYEDLSKSFVINVFNTKDGNRRMSRNCVQKMNTSTNVHRGNGVLPEVHVYIYFQNLWKNLTSTMPIHVHKYPTFDRIC